MTEAERQLALERRYEELINNPRYVTKPKPAVDVAGLPVSAADAEELRNAVPGSVLSYSKRKDGVTKIIRPLKPLRPTDPNIVWSQICERMEDAQGRAPSGAGPRPAKVQHEYNPFDGLKR